MTRRASLTGISTDAPGVGVTQYHAENLIPFPSRSILASEAPLHPLNLSQARFNEALLFALLVNFLCWGLIFIAGRWLLSVFL